MQLSLKTQLCIIILVLVIFKNNYIKKLFISMMVAGMTVMQLEELAAPSVDSVKISRRDLAYVLSQVTF